MGRRGDTRPLSLLVQAPQVSRLSISELDYIPNANEPQERFYINFG